MALIIQRPYKALVNGDLLQVVPPPTPDAGESTFYIAKFPSQLLQTKNWRPRGPSVRVDIEGTVPVVVSWSRETVQSSSWSGDTVQSSDWTRETVLSL